MFSHFVKSGIFLPCSQLSTIALPSSAALLTLTILKPRSTSAGPRNQTLFLLLGLVSALFSSPHSQAEDYLRLRPCRGQHSFLKMLSQLSFDMNVLPNKIQLLGKCFLRLEMLSGETQVSNSLASTGQYFQVEVNKVMCLKPNLEVQL